MPKTNFKKYIKSWDQYGHPVRLKFNDKGDTHKTFLGGTMSILSYVLLAAYFIMLIHKMVNYNADKNFTTALKN